MSSKTPWPNPISGFAEGLESGTKMGLLRRQQNLAEQESLAKAAEAEAKTKREDIAAKFAAAKELQGVRHPAIQKARLNMYATTVKKNAEYFGIDPSAIPDNIEWNDDFTIPLKELDSAFEAWKEGKISDSQGLQALRETMTKIGGVMDSADVEKLRAEKEKQFGEMQQGKALTGAANLRGIIENYPQLSEDTTTRDSMLTDYNRLAIEGGATPEQMLFKGAEGGTVKEWTVGDETQYWLTDKQGMPIKRVEGMGGGRYKPVGTTVNVGEEGAFKKELGKDLATEYIKVQKEAIGAANNLNRLSILEKALPKGYQGKLANLGANMGAYYEAVTGEKIEGASETQIAQAISNRIALTMVGAQVEGGGMPANLFSEADREFIVNANVSPKLTPEANKRLLALAKKTEEFKVIYAKAWRDYVKEHGTADAGIYSFIEKTVSEHYNLPKENKKSNPSGGKSKEVTFNPQTGRFE